MGWQLLLGLPYVRQNIPSYLRSKSKIIIVFELEIGVVVIVNNVAAVQIGACEYRVVILACAVTLVTGRTLTRAGIAKINLFRETQLAGYD